MIKLILFFICITLGYSYPGGAPKSVCDTMIPGHSVVPEQCEPKYTIQADKYQYHANETIRITVRGVTADDEFKGFLLVAKNEKTQQIIGTWSVINSLTKSVACDGKEDTGITHSSPSHKSQIDAVWHAPSMLSEENTIIKVTIVKSFSKIYVDCFSIKLTSKSNNSPHVRSIDLGTEKKILTNTNVTRNDRNDTMTTERINVKE